MTTQEEYNEWFKLMLKKHFINHKYELIEQIDEEIKYLDAKISHPDDEEKDIYLSTYGKELTVSIWEHHEHHDSFEEDDHEQEFRDVCEFIDDIINDKVFFAVAYKNGRTVYGTRAYELKELHDPKVDKLRIISWSGKHDQIIEKKGNSKD